jgi:hypothetical protein
MIRADALAFAGPPLADAVHPGLDLVEDERYHVFVGEVAEPREESFERDDRSALPWMASTQTPAVFGIAPYLGEQRLDLRERGIQCRVVGEPLTEAVGILGAFDLCEQGCVLALV